MVSGLGLIGLITVQLLKANGCAVLGADFDRARLDLAEQFGAQTVDLSKGEDPVASARTFSHGSGVDGVIITAHTESNEPIHQSALMCRKRGRIVLIGQTGLNISRDDFYEKELSFQVSCSYGPGRYDPLYEDKGQDYPIGFVRWTEQRNFEAVLSMFAQGKLNVEPLISRRFPFEQAKDAYEVLETSKDCIGIVLQYKYDDPEAEAQVLRRVVSVKGPETPDARTTEKHPSKTAVPVVGVIGTGDHARRIILPALKRNDVRLKSVASRGGVSAGNAARKFGFEEAVSDTDAMMNDPDINTVFILTRHDSHAGYVLQALSEGKSVFVEKPLAIFPEELDGIEATYRAAQDAELPPILILGFNRRFAPQIQKAKELLDGLKEPKAVIITVNAGDIPPQHWIQDREVGGGRIVGEGCHFIDLMRFLVDAPVMSVNATRIGDAPGVAVTEDKTSISLTFEDGSFGTVHYLANGHKSFPKERIEIFCGGRILQVNNFLTMFGFGWPGFTKMRLWRQDKGHRNCVTAFMDAVRKGKPSPIPFSEILEVSRVTFKAAEAIRDQPT
ncbi:bi-domain-containing oxidoreductase [Thermodesulfobacteriota bacterium]